MRTTHASATLLSAFFAISMLACGSNEGRNNASSDGRNPLEIGVIGSTTNSESPLMGTWVSGDYSLTFKSDNTYLCDSNRDGVPEIWGRVMISGNVVIFSDAAGSSSSGRKDGGQVMNGPYTYTVYGTALTFSPVLDVCPDRINILCLSYQKR